MKYTSESQFIISKLYSNQNSDHVLPSISLDTQEALKMMVGRTLDYCTPDPTGSYETIFHFTDGICISMYHRDQCCERVYIESVVGNIADLIGHPLLLAEEVVDDTYTDESCPDDNLQITWTFYKFATIKGYVDIRVKSESNGYYSEQMDFKLMGKGWFEDNILEGSNK